MTKATARRLASETGKFNIENFLKTVPKEILEAYEDFRVCRQLQMVTHSVTRAGKEYQRTEPYSIGYTFLPFPGSVEDQPVRLMQFFEEFMNAERRNFGV
jgi:hypothetical protein